MDHARETTAVRKRQQGESHRWGEQERDRQEKIEREIERGR